MEWLTQNWAWILILAFVGMLLFGFGGAHQCGSDKKDGRPDKTPTQRTHQH